MIEMVSCILYVFTTVRKNVQKKVQILLTLLKVPMLSPQHSCCRMMPLVRANLPSLGGSLKFLWLTYTPLTFL